MSWLEAAVIVLSVLVAADALKKITALVLLYKSAKLQVDALRPPPLVTDTPAAGAKFHACLDGTTREGWPNDCVICASAN